MDENVKNNEPFDGVKIPTPDELASLNNSIGIIGKVNAIKKEQKAVDEVRDTITEALKIDEDRYAKMEALYADLSSDEIKKMTKEEFDARFVIDGEVLRFDSDGNDNEVYERTKDSIIYFKEMDEAHANLDKLIAEMEEECEKSDKEMKQIFDEYGSYDKILRNVLLDSIEKTGDDRAKKKKIKMLEWLDDALYLTKLEDWVFEDGDAVWKELYGNDSDSNLVIRRFNSKAEKIKLPINIENLHMLAGFEQKFLNDDFKNVYNLFLLIMVRYVSLLSVDKYHQAERVYAIRIFIYLKHLMADVPMFTEEDKKTFIDSIERILRRLGPENFQYKKPQEEVK